MKTVVFWDMMPCRSRKNRRFEGTYRVYLPGENTISAPISQRECASRRTAKRASCNGTSTAVFVTVEARLMCRFLLKVLLISRPTGDNCVLAAS
jgi:hypothetical protein